MIIQNINIREIIMINKAIIIGRVGNKSDKTTKNGQEMVVLNIATNRKWTNKQGQSEEKTTWHTVNFFGKLAEIAKRYSHVGSLVYIEGEINHNQISSGENAGQWAYSITANQLKLLPSPTKNNDESKPNKDKSGNPNKQWNEGDFDDSEIPF